MPPRQNDKFKLKNAPGPVTQAVSPAMAKWKQNLTRRITKDDDVTTIPNRVTFPVGSFVSNPSTAAAGALGGPFGNQPAQPNIFQQTTPNAFFGANGPGLGDNKPKPPAVNPLLKEYQQPRPPTQTSFPGYYPYTPGQVPQRPGPVNPELDLVRQRQRTINYMQDTNKLPNYLDTSTISYMAQQGLDPSQLAQFYTFNANTGSYQLNQNGQTINQNAAAGGPLKPGQYKDPQTGEIKIGAAPFGTNSAGQRLDASGNVWNPATATADIYGGKFIQEGETRWERNKAGRLIKVQYGSGGKKRVVAGGKGQSKRGRREEVAPAAAPIPYQEETTQPRSYQQSVSFNASVG